jgi:hypothetical protein
VFSVRSLPEDVSSIRAEYAPESLVLDVDQDFETLPPEAAENLGLVVDALDPASYPDDWLPADTPEVLRRYASEEFTVGMPGDGTVAWTRQTDPPVVLVKARARGTPADFLDFLIAESFCQIGLGAHEQFLPFFGAQYRDLDGAVPLGPANVYQIAAALYDAWVGLNTRSVFREWERSHDRLYNAWTDTGERLQGRVEGLPKAVAREETSFPDATELACSAIKHDLELPVPFSALDTRAYREHETDYAIQWAKKTFEQLQETD